LNLASIFCICLGGIWVLLELIFSFFRNNFYDFLMSLIMASS
jgi:hypothetical protein